MKSERVPEGHLRNWKTASAQEVPQRIYGRKAAGNFSER